MVVEVIELLGDVARRVDMVVELWKPLRCFLETLVPNGELQNARQARACLV